MLAFNLANFYSRLFFLNDLIGSIIINLLSAPFIPLKCAIFISISNTYRKSFFVLFNLISGMESIIYCDVYLLRLFRRLNVFLNNLIFRLLT